MFGALFCFHIYAWFLVWSGGSYTVPEIDFLDVGQGDATLLKLPPNINILTDAGPDSKVLSALAAAAPPLKRIDLVIISHPQLDHFNGFRFILDKYSIGAVILNGRNDPGVGEWDQLVSDIGQRKLPVIVLGKGDSIRMGDSHIKILGPAPEFRESGELNDTAIVEYISTADWSAMLTGDTGFAQEEYMGRELRGVDILKVGHHGSRFSTGAKFLATIQPKIAVISAGKDNRYGHPTPATLERLQAAGVKVFRTDLHGIIRISEIGGELQVSAIPTGNGSH